MKKLFLFASGIALMATSCSDDFVPKGNTEGNIPFTGNSKIIASLQVGESVGTRTYLEDSYYKWGSADGIGVYVINAEDATNPVIVENAEFEWYGANEDDAMAANFQGQAYLPANQTLYAYYPWTETSPYNDGIMTSSILATQTFNYQNANFTTVANWTKKATGSFANGMSPAIAVGESFIDDDNVPTAKLSFQPLAGYLVFPISTNMKQVTLNRAYLTVSGGDENDALALAGSITVNMSDLAGATVEKPFSIEDVTYQTVEEGAAATITLNLGGFTLKQNELVDIWFVVPANLQLASSTIQLAFEDPAQYPMTKTLSKDFGTTGQNPLGETVGLNNVRYISSAEGGAWYYNPTNAFLASNACKFIEYANLVTLGNEAIVNWALAKNDEQYTTVMQYSYLQDMLEFQENQSAETLIAAAAKDTFSDSEVTTYVKGIKAATLVNDITIDVPTVTAELNSTIGTGIFAPNLPTYLSFYTNFLNGTQNYSKGYIPSIGGNGTLDGGEGTNYGFSIDGSGYTINNLSIYGTGIFAKVKNPNYNAAFVSVNDVTFNTVTMSVNPNVSYEGFYYYLGYPFGVSFSEVSVDGQFTAMNGENAVPAEKQCLVGIMRTSIFPQDGTVMTPYVTKEETFGSPKMYIAAQLSVNSKKFSFPKAGVSVTDFGTIGISANGENAVISVANANDAYYIIDNAITNNYSYSVLDTPTTEGGTPNSYWTGTKSENAANGTAEKLAYYAQTPATGNFEMTYNLDLMGSYSYTNPITNNEVEGSQVWYSVRGTNTVNVIGSATANKISNVYICPVDSEGKNVYPTGLTPTLTLLGWQGNVYSSVEDGIVDINDLVINNVTEAGSYILKNTYTAAIAVFPTQTNSVKVTGYQVNAVTGNNAEPSTVGGLFQVNQASDDPADSEIYGMYDYKYIGSSTLSGNFNVSEESGVLYGWAAGSLVLPVTVGANEGNNKTNAYTVPDLPSKDTTNDINAYGIVKANVTVSGTNSVWLNFGNLGQMPVIAITGGCSTGYGIYVNYGSGWGNYIWDGTSFIPDDEYYGNSSASQE